MSSSCREIWRIFWDFFLRVITRRRTVLSAWYLVAPVWHVLCSAHMDTLPNSTGGFGFGRSLRHLLIRTRRCVQMRCLISVSGFFPCSHFHLWTRMSVPSNESWSKTSVHSMWLSQVGRSLGSSPALSCGLTRPHCDRGEHAKPLCTMTSYFYYSWFASYSSNGEFRIRHMDEELFWEIKVRETITPASANHGGK